MKLNGSQILLETLLEQGTDTIFGYPGGAALNIYDELYKYSDRIRHVLAAHEQGASHAADGYARATGKVGVVLATSGPGATNLVTGIATAFMDSIPLIAITANVGTNFIGRDSFQEIYIAGVTMPITKHNFVVRNVEELADTVRHAYEIAISGRPGPVLIDIPKDVTAAVCEFEHKPAVHKRPNPKIQHEQISKMAEMVNAAERPVILFGGGVISSDACELLLRFMKRGDIPACHSLMGIGALDKEEPLNLGLIGMHGWLSAGRVATKMGDFASAAKVVQVDIDESEVNKNIAVEHSVIGDVHDVLEAVLPLIDHADHTPWKEQIASWKERMDYKPKDNDAVLRPHQLMKKIDELIGKDDIVATDVGQHQMWAAQFTGRSKPRTFLTSAKEVKGLKLVTAQRDGMDANALRKLGDFLRDKEPKIVGVLASVKDGKVTLLAVCGKEAVASGIKAGDIIKAIAPICGGKGGGKPDSAMGGGTEVSKVDDALAAVDDLILSKLG